MSHRTILGIDGEEGSDGEYLFYMRDVLLIPTPSAFLGFDAQPSSATRHLA